MINKTKTHCVYKAKLKAKYRTAKDERRTTYIGQRNKPNTPRYHKIAGYPKEHFIWKILHSCLTQKQANKLEKLEIENHNSILPNGFNKTNGGKTECKVSEETKEKHSIASKGNKSFLGRKHTEETKLLMSKNNAMKRPEVAAKHRGRPKPGTSKAMKLNNPMKRPEVAAKHRGRPKPGTSKAMTGKNNPMKRPEVAIKISKNNLQKAKQRLINRPKNHPRINCDKRAIKRITKHIEKLKLLISQ